MEELSENDRRRYWRETREFGQMSKVSPLQSIIGLRGIRTDEFSSFAADEEPIYTNYLNSLGSTQGTIEISNLTITLENISCESYSSDFLGNTFKATELIGMISAIEEERKNLAPVTTVVPESFQIPIYEPPVVVGAPKKQKVSMDESNENEVDTAPQKKGPFFTAKAQFVKEGGKLENKPTNTNTGGIASSLSKKVLKSEKDGKDSQDELPPELQNFDKALVEKIEADIIEQGQAVKFEDIAGLDFVKKCVNELICWPMSRPDLFQGLRALPRGLLLFGPPGTGKTLIGKAIAFQVGATFFSISASSLTSKWIGEGEKTVRTLFAVAAYRQPSVVFIDEVDSLLCQRSSDENEASRRMKTEFLVQLDGAGTNVDARVVLIGATNRPDELDEAARRRFVKRIYIPLPDDAGRHQLFETLLRGSHHSTKVEDITALVQRTAGYSGADIRSLCTEAAMGPMRELAFRAGNNLANIRASDIPPIQMHHFEVALDTVAPSVSTSDLTRYVDWNSVYGTFRKIDS